LGGGTEPLLIADEFVLIDGANLNVARFSSS
jgi:hypothetical protein